jgi:high-affinity iron transporter
VLRVNLARLFQITNVVLLFIAAGMVGLGIHELIEASLVPAIIDPVWNINPLLSDKSSLGELLKALFGYNGNPALTELIGYLTYLAVVGWMVVAPSRWKTRTVLARNPY